MSCPILTITGAACQPPNGVQRYCGTDNKTVYVWNQVTCQYDSTLCSTGHCTNGYCDNPPPPPANVTSINVGYDYPTKPATRSVLVSGTGSGSYQVKEGSTVIFTGTLTNGSDQIHDVDNIPNGTHTWCATPSSNNACNTFTVTGGGYNKWSCSDNCLSPGPTGEYNSQPECQAACNAPACDTIPLNNWAPAKLIMEPNETVNVTVRSSTGNIHFNIVSIGLLGLKTTLIDANTDSTGCYSGILSAMSAGTYDVAVCFNPTYITCDVINIQKMTWKSTCIFTIPNPVPLMPPYCIEWWHLALIGGIILVFILLFAIIGAIT